MNRTMKIWIIAFLCASVVGVCAQESGEPTGKTDHNKEEHERLCGVLKAAVGKWGTSGEGLSDPLKKALGRTIFGNEEGGVLGELKSLPDDYTKGGAIRGNFCGQPYSEPGFFSAPHRWSGHSAPHDRVCLCTAGDKRWPVNITGTTLCGKDKEVLGASGDHGWSGKIAGKEQIEKTWGSVVHNCLLGGGLGTNLKEVLGKFTNTLEHRKNKWYENRYLLGDNGSDDYACDGTPNSGICVVYYNTTDSKTWWSDLEKALVLDAEAEKQKKKAEEAERKTRDEAAKEDTLPPALTSSGQLTTNKTEQNKTATLQESIRRLNLTSGTPISQPSSWLLSVAILI
ncbi:Variant surface glycoprotein [Trypanosoma congolense IL3000]|uniref:Variant surface glycoprotein n=1 Tax=Trypanosoma congolense (strain IL3000) TaxID=1068625 RepID=F9WBS3_TRYCI|nr:Variant surface glycoprotein [Trypanosoma congolense IL3000]